MLWSGLGLAALAALAFWLNFPQPHFAPARLETAGPDCPRTSRAFVPTNATEVPELPSQGVPQKQRDHMLWRANTEACPCGCQLSLAACRINYPACRWSANALKKVIAETQAQGLSK